MFFATNIANFLACRHIATLEGEGEAGEIRRKHYADPGTELLRKLGLEHEQKYLRELIDVRGRKVVEIPTDVPWREAAALTREAMAAGADAIYQATFLNGTSADSLAPRGARGGRDRRRPSEELESIMGGRVEVVSGDEPLGTQSTPGPSEEVEWGGRADFLLRVETPSKLGPWSYEVVETKLAKSTKAGALIQLCFYSDLVARIQGLEPKRMHVVLGGGAKAEEFRVQRYLAYFRKVRREFQAALAAKPITYPEPVEHCHVCSWFPNCDERRHADDHLSLVAGITSNQRKALVERDVTKLAQLATLALPVSPEVRGQRSEVGSQTTEIRSQKAEVGDQRSEVGSQRSEVGSQRAEVGDQRSEVRRIAAAPLLRIREQARVQMRGRDEKRPVHELLEPVETGRGLAALPLPSPGDLFLDFEGDPFAFEQGLEYLIGAVTFAEKGRWGEGEKGRWGEGEKGRWGEGEENFGFRIADFEIEYEGMWAFNRGEEKRAFEKFIGSVIERRRQYPDMHIYHYAPYETTAIKHLAGRHAICTDEVDELLRAGHRSVYLSRAQAVVSDCRSWSPAQALILQAMRAIATRRRSHRGCTLQLCEVSPANPPPLEAAKKLALLLDSTILPMQGPPGSGKTYTGAQMIVELVKAGRRVGVTAVSHKVISNLLNDVCKAAKKASIHLRIVQKPNKFDGCDEETVQQVKDNEDVLQMLKSGEAQVAAGTAWLWAREEMAGSVDVLFVDEAGQMSLANVLAVSPAAKSVVLLGDPQQLDQPQKGVHPPGAEVSALAHLLNGRSTIGTDQGLFLSETWRLHPDICAFTSEVFYDGRLVSRPENSNHRLNCRGGTPWPPQVAGVMLAGDDATFANAEGPRGDKTVATMGRPRRDAPTTAARAVWPFDGTGLRYVPVNHSGNQSDSPEEVQRIVEIVRELLRGETTWTSKEGETLPLELKDLLIVAPYNVQVSALKEALPGAKVGTVDKFQGQQAPVVFYSMATSTPEDAPRGMEFLYSLNRLNVATSRAQCLTILVASPALFQVQCKTPRQIELANAFCRFLEMAQSG